MNKVTVLGSLNMDLVVAVKSLPKIGETLLAKGMKKVPGGKGANQALASARLEANVYMIGKVGNDDNGIELVDNLKKDNINTDFIFNDEVAPTGIAFINVDEQGDNSIIVVPGSNASLSKDEIYKAENVIKNSDVIVSQFEVPIDVIIEGFRIAKENGVITLLNPAPANEIPAELLELTDIIVPNETEAQSITGIKVENEYDAQKAGMALIENGVSYVIITLGDKGAALVSKDKCEIIPALKVKAVDTTAAGDSFIGALSSKLSKDDKLSFDLIKNIIPFANKVSSIVVTREGAQTSLPYLHEIE